MHRRILLLALPNIISNLTVPLLGMADLAVLGHLGSERYIGALALGSMVFSILYWGFTFLRMSSSGFASQSYGRRRLDEAADVLLRSLLLGLGIGWALVLLQGPLGRLAFAWMDGSPALLSMAKSYYRIRIWDAPATLGLYAIAGWLIGMQNTRSPMYLAIGTNVLNVLFNLLFVLGFGLKTEGVALGSVLAQWLGFLAALFLLWRYYGKVLRRAQWQRAVQLEPLWQFFRLNADIFVRMLCVIGVMSFFTNQSSAYGEKNLAINTLLMQFFYLFSFFADGFAYAAEALTGRYIGAGDATQLRRAIRASLIWGAGIGLIVSGLYALLGTRLLHLLTNNTQLIDQAKPFWPWMVVVPLVSVASFVWDGVYVGATAARAMRNTLLISALVFFGSYYAARSAFGAHTLWLALLLYLASRGVLQSLWARRTVYRNVARR